MKKMYGITTGEYENYEILCLCESKEDAEVLLKKLDDDRYYYEIRIIELPIVSKNVTKSVELLIQEVIHDDGTVAKYFEQEIPRWPWEKNYEKQVYWCWRRFPWSNKGGKLEVVGDDHHLVRKLFLEKKTLILNNEDLRKSPLVQEDI